MLLGLIRLILAVPGGFKLVNLGEFLQFGKKFPPSFAIGVLDPVFKCNRSVFSVFCLLLLEPKA